MAILVPDGEMMRLAKMMSLSLYATGLMAACAPVDAGSTVSHAVSAQEYLGLFDRLEHLNINDRLEVASSFGITFSLSSDAPTYRFWQAGATSTETLPALRIEYGERTALATQGSNFVSITMVNPRLSITDVMSRYPGMELVNISHDHGPRTGLVYEVLTDQNKIRFGFEGEELLLKTISAISHIRD